MSAASFPDVHRTGEFPGRDADICLNRADRATRTRHSGAEWRENDFPELQG